MHGKTIRLSLAAFLVTVLASAASSIDEPPRIASVNMAEALNTQWREKLFESCNKATPFELNANSLKRGLCGGGFPRLFTCGCRFGGALSIPAPKFYFDDPITPLIEAFKTHTSVSITTIETSLLIPPNLAPAFCQELQDGYRITSKIQTSDAFIATQCFKILMTALEPEPSIDEFWFEPADSMEREIANTRPPFPPSIFIEFEGKSPMKIEIFLQSKLSIAIGRTKDKWGYYTLSPTAKQFLEASIHALHAIYADEKSGDGEN